MKLFSIFISTIIFLTLSTGIVGATDSNTTTNNGLPAEVNQLISRILNEGCLDQHITKTHSDGSTSTVNQRVGAGCNEQQPTALDQHITKNENGTSTDLKQTVTLPTSSDSTSGSQACTDQHINQQSNDGSTTLDQNVCADVLSAMYPTSTPTATATPAPEANPTELPSTGPGPVLAISLVGIAASLISRRYFIS